jgi:hypothetical protein
LFFSIFRETSVIYDVTEFLLRSGKEVIPFDTIATLNEKSGSYLINGLAPFSADVSSRSNTRIIATDEHFPIFHRIRLIHGTWFENSDEPAAVIDASLAVSLFFTENAVGKPITVGGTTLTVVGVYKSDESLLQKVSAENRTPVFLPFGSLHETPIGPSYLYIKEKARDGSLRRVTYDTILQLDGDTQGAFLRQYHDTEMHEKEWITAQMGKVLWLGMATVLAVFALLFCWRASRRYIAWFSDIRARHEAVSYKTYLLKLSVPAAAAVLALVLLGTSYFVPYLPDHFLPADRCLLNIPEQTIMSVFAYGVKTLIVNHNSTDVKIVNVGADNIGKETPLLQTEGGSILGVNIMRYNGKSYQNSGADLKLYNRLTINIKIEPTVKE